MIEPLNNVQRARCAGPYALHLPTAVYAMHQCRRREENGVCGTVEKVHNNRCETVVVEKRRGKGWTVGGCEMFEKVCNCDSCRGCCQEGGIIALGFVRKRHDTVQVLAVSLPPCILQGSA